jgi:hypothetical protein
MGRVEYTEDSGVYRIEDVKRAHLSIEVGHFYMSDFKGEKGPAIEDHIRVQLRRVAPLVEAVRNAAVCGKSKPRVSTCFLLDDYFGGHHLTPEAMMPPLLKAAKDVGVAIDYVAREAACAVTHDGVRLAEIAAAMIQSEPSPGTTGARPPARESGWLCNGDRSPNTSMAMRSLSPWMPRQEYGVDNNNHSILVDIELWRDLPSKDNSEPDRLWSCAFLAAIWQLLRLGLLRDCGRAVANPERWEPGSMFPNSWSQLPSVIQLNLDAAPFAAYRTASILPRDFLRIEHSIQVILDHLELEPGVIEQAGVRAEGEGIELPAKVTDRLSHLFIEGK